MATPAFLRYLPARLKPLSSPAVWAPLTVFTLLSIFVWEYHKNPDWFNRPQITNLDPNSNLTPEEQARLSEIDTLDLLLRNARTPTSEEDLSTSLINPAAPDAATEESNTIAPDRTLAGKDNPFGIYEEQYKFPGAGSTPTVRASQPEASTSSLKALTSTPFSSNSRSALSDALDRQQSALRSTDESLSPSASEAPFNAQSSLQIEPSSAQPPSTSRAAIGQPSTLPNSVSSGNNGRNNGGSIAFPSQSSGDNRVPAPFIPTTADMSPPVGTTGYQVPSSASLPVFNTPAQQPTRNPFSQSVSVPAAGSVAPLPAPTTPSVNYTAPRFTQPEQSRRRPQ